MLKTLKKQSKKKIIAKYRIIKFLKKELWQHLIVIAFVSFCAWLFSKPIEAILFCTSHIVIRIYFDKQYHCRHENKSIAIFMCLTLTYTIAFFGIASCLPLSISLLSTIFVAYLICWAGYVVQDRLDYKVVYKDLQNKFDEAIKLLKLYENIDLYKMEESELRQYGASKQLSERQQDILCMRVIDHLKISEICEYYHFGRSSIKYHIAEIKKKLDISQI